MNITSINSIYIYNRNLQTKPQIKFGKSENSCPNKPEQDSQKISPKEAKWIAQKAEIDARYRRQVEHLSYYFSENDIGYDTYMENLREIQKDRDFALRKALIEFHQEQ